MDRSVGLQMYRLIISCSFAELGKVAASRIKAAFEIGVRKKINEAPTKVRSSADAARILYDIKDSEVENFVVIFLNQDNSMIKKEMLFQGGIANTIIDPRVVFKKALIFQCSGVILAHNHPSGNLQPSNPDVRITRKLCEGGKLLDIRVMDHLIMSPRGYYSFADEGMMPE